MVDRVRQVLQSKAGYAVCALVVVGAILLTVHSVKANLGATDAVSYSKTRVAVCSETGKAFEVALTPGLTFPVKSPYSGKNTGHLAEETCNWTADGKVDSKDTYLLMNKTLGKTGPTFCPECHRLVVRNNPRAVEGRQPPPSEAEYAARKVKHVEQLSAE